MQRTNGNSQIVDGVKNDSSGIGYVGIGYLQDASGVKPIRIAASDQAEYIDPRNRPDVVSGKYPITRPLYQYTDGIPSSHIKDFIKFELSPEGQKIVDDMGFIPLTKEYEQVNKQTIGI